jgi:arginase
VLDRLHPETMTTARTGQNLMLLGLAHERGAATAGTLMGPDALRTAGLARVLAALGHQVSDRGNLHQAPEAEVDMPEPLAARCRALPEVAGWARRIHDEAHDLARESGVPIFLGGDHSISIGTVAGMSRRCAETGQDIAVLWIDAHADYNTPETSPSGNMHGMALAAIAGEPSLAPVLGRRRPHPVARDNIHVFGARSVDPGERARIAAHGIDCVDMRQIDERGVVALMGQRIARWRERDVHLHVSLDADFLDPSVAPGTGTTVPGGATYREAHLIMEMLADSGLVGSLDVVELNPFLDQRGQTAVVMTELVASLFGRTVLDRRPGAVAAD